MKFKTLNEDRHTDLVKVISDALPYLGDYLLEDLFRIIEGQLERPFTGDLLIKNKDGRLSEYLLGIFKTNSIGKVRSALEKTDPRNTKAVIKLLKGEMEDEYSDCRIKFNGLGKHYDSYQVTGKNRDCPFEILVEREPRAY